MNQWNNYKGVCRTETATPVLLITLLICEAAGIAMTFKLCLIQEPLSCDQFSLGLIALSWKVPDILARTWLNIFKGKIHYSKLRRTLNLCAPTLNLGAPIPNIGTPTQSF